MDGFLIILQESIYALIVFGCFTALAFFKGRQTITNVILGLYLALLLTLQFPYFTQLLADIESPRDQAIFSIAIFIFFSAVSTWLFARILPREYSEKMFEGTGSKFALALAGTILVLAYSFHALPVTDLVSPGGPVTALFGSAEYFFWWLLVPIAILFVF